MNKKIIILFFLLLVLGSSLVVYSYTNQPAEENNDISDEAILKELDELFVSEDDDIEIGDIL